MYDYIVVGAGYAGAICAREIAEKLNSKVLVIDRRPHIAGNMFDEMDESGILVHRYGPHISVMNSERAFNYLSKFTDWVPYLHTVKAEIDNIEVPLPFNFTAIDYLFDTQEAINIKETLISNYGEGANVPILEMRKSSNPLIHELADFVYEKVFVHYTMKMWGLGPEEIDPSVTARIPVRLSYDNKHFMHKYQVMPKHGFTKLFESLLNHPNITIRLNTEAQNVISLNSQNSKVYFEDQKYEGKLIYSGALDELFSYDYGVLPYRSLEFKFDTYKTNHIQDSTVLNWPDDRPATRRTEMKRLTQQDKEGITSTITEYPGAYNKDGNTFNEPYYPIVSTQCTMLYEQYKKRVKCFEQIYLVGRLADYKYYNMEATVLRALDVADLIISGKPQEYL